MSDELWRWWEENKAPDDSDLHPHHRGGACFPLVILALIVLVLVAGCTAVEVMS